MGKHKSHEHGHHRHHHRHHSGQRSKMKTILATVYHKGDVYSNIQMDVEDDLTSQEGLLKRAGQIIGKAENLDRLAVYRYSKSKDAYVLMDNEAEFATIKRSLTVKHHLCFYIKELADGMTPKPRLSPSRNQPPPYDNEKKGDVTNEDLATGLAPDVAVAPATSSEDAPLLRKRKESKGQSQSGSHCHSECRHRPEPQMSFGPNGLVDVTQLLDLPDDFFENIETMFKDAGQSVLKTLKSEIYNAVRDWCEPVDTPQNAKSSMFEVEGLFVGPQARQSTATTSACPPSYSDAHKSMHKALCDQCDKRIVGRRYKCLKCRDFDFCEDCVDTGRQTHRHAFACLHSSNDYLQTRRMAHACDGPLCRDKKPETLDHWLQCNVCLDYDLCLTCAEHPSLDHDKTHPFSRMDNKRVPVPIGSLHNYLAQVTCQEKPTEEEPLIDVSSTPAVGVDEVAEVHEEHKEVEEEHKEAEEEHKEKEKEEEEDEDEEFVEVLGFDSLRNNIYLTVQNKTGSILRDGWFNAQINGKDVVFCGPGTVAPGSVGTFEAHYGYDELFYEDEAATLLNSLTFQTTKQEYSTKFSPTLEKYPLHIWDCVCLFHIKDNVAEVEVVNNGNCSWPHDVAFTICNKKYLPNDLSDGFDEEVKPGSSIKYDVPLCDIADSWGALLINDHKLFFNTELPIVEAIEEEQEAQATEKPLSLSSSDVKFPRLPTESREVSPSSSMSFVAAEGSFTKETTEGQEVQEDEVDDDLSCQDSEEYWNSGDEVNDALSSHESDYDVVDIATDFSEAE